MIQKSLKFGIPILSLLTVSSFLTTKTFHVEIDIAAPPDAVWAVLMDTEAYSEWNPTVVEVQGRYEVGADLPTTVKTPSGDLLDMTNTVRAVEPFRELRQTGGIPAIITYDHRWLLEPIDGGTRAIQHEVDRGGFLWFWNSDWIEPAYAEANEALAKRVAAFAE